MAIKFYILQSVIIHILLPSNLIFSATIYARNKFIILLFSSGVLLSSYVSFSEFTSILRIILWGDVLSTSFTLTLSNILNFSNCLAVGLRYGLIWSINSKILSNSSLVLGNNSFKDLSNLVVLSYIFFRYCSPSWSCTNEKSLRVSNLGDLFRILKSWSFLLILIS